MRSADVATLLRLPLLAIVVWAIVAQLNAIAVVVLVIFLFLSDTFDGYLATEGRHSLPDMVGYLLGEATGSGGGRKPGSTPRYAGYLDISVDRLVEYAFWLLFAFLSVLPIFVFAVLFVRNTVADYLMLTRKKSFAKMHTAFGRIASSHLSRGAYGALKAINFAYLSLVAVAAWPIGIGYILTVLVVVYSLLRGAAEVYEALS